MAPSKSLRRLLVWRVLVIALLYTVFLAAVVDAQVNDLLKTVRSNILTSRLWEVGSYLGRDDDHRLILNMPQARADFFSQPGIDFVIRDEGGKVLFHSPANWLDYTPPSPPQHGTPYEFQFTDAAGGAFVGQSGWILFDGAPYLVQVTQSRSIATEFPDMLLHRFLYKAGLLAIPFVGLLVLSIIYSVRQSLAPVKALSGEAQNITFDLEGRRIASSTLPEEVKPLVEAFNTVLDRLEAGINAQKEFTAHAAHELRTPLSVLQANISLLGDAKVTETLKADVDAMARLVEQLLAAARLEDSTLLPLEPVDLAKVVRDACIGIWPLMLKHSLTLEVSAGSDPVWIDGNAESIGRALRNLLENALHHAPTGSRVDVELSGTEVRVRDSGPGIPPEDRARIFDRFWRKSADKNGAGLGLYIVQTIMQRHGGAVRVECPEDSGSIFTLSFPARKRTG